MPVVSDNEIRIAVEEVPENPEYVQQMIDKAEGQQTSVETPTTAEEQQQQEEPNKEKLLAGKYKTPEELEKAYKELEKKLGQKQQQTPQQQQEEKPAEEDQKAPPQVPTIEQTKDVLESMDLDFDSFYQEIQEKGSLTEDSYKKFESHGISREMVDLTIEGYRSVAERATNTVYDICGGEDGFKVVSQWAAVNAPYEAQQFNQAAARSDVKQLQLVTEAIMSKYTKANGQSPKLIQGDTGAVGSGDIYETTAQLMEDMHNPMYNKDAAFRKKVEEKLARSPIL